MWDPKENGDTDRHRKKEKRRQRKDKERNHDREIEIERAWDKKTERRGDTYLCGSYRRGRS